MEEIGCLPGLALFGIRKSSKVEDEKFGSRWV